MYVLSSDSLFRASLLNRALCKEVVGESCATVDYRLCIEELRGRVTSSWGPQDSHLLGKNPLNGARPSAMGVKRCRHFVLYKTATAGCRPK